MYTKAFSVDVTPDWEGFLSNIRREGTPSRVHFIELFLDAEIQDVIGDRYHLLESLARSDQYYGLKRQVILQRFLGYDYVRCGVEGIEMSFKRLTTDDTSALQRSEGRHYAEEHTGPITNWDEFEKYPWPDPSKATTVALEWYQENLPDGMCIIGSGGFGHFFEWLSWLMGYETLCFALFDNRQLVEAICERILEINTQIINRLLEFDRVKMVWASDDLGFRSGTLISPNDLREFILPLHKKMADAAHKSGRPYLLHSCGNLSAIMDDLICGVGIDGKHSFEDVIEGPVTAKEKYGDRIALLGGIDVDFLCRADEEQIRREVREVLGKCLPGGGYCLGTGNSVANYIPVDNYLAMLDEGRRFCM